MYSSLRTARGPGFRSRLTVVLGAVLLVAGLGPAPAVASPGPGSGKDTSPRAVEPPGEVPGGFASWKELLTLQKKLVTAADRVTAAVEGLGGGGFAGIVAAPQNRELRIHWKGAVPGRVADLVTELREDVPVRVLPAAFSARELKRETDRLVRVSAGAFTSITPNVDGSGLTVTGADVRLTRSKVAGSAVSVTVEAGVAPAPASRWNDSPPWWAGAAARNAATGAGCSTGWTVNYGGATRMLSVPHCGTPGQLMTDPTGEPIGPVAAANVPRDVMLVTATAGGRVYNNYPGTISPEFGNKVAGTTGTYVGMMLCTSGAYSGTVCLCQVKAVGVTIYTGRDTIFGMARVEHTQYKNAAGQGDSGGPVETPDPTELTEQYAVGTISAIDTSAPAACTGYVVTGRVCSWRLYYTPWSNVTAAYPGITIVTG